jgi:hypothetical protein
MTRHFFITPTGRQLAGSDRESVCGYEIAIANLAASAAVLPAQLLPRPVVTTESPGVFTLMEAILKDAIKCFQKRFTHHGQRAQRLAEEAKAWLFSDEYDWPFSCVNICAVLGIEVETLRQELNREGGQQSVCGPYKRRRRILLRPKRRLATSEIQTGAER